MGIPLNRAFGLFINCTNGVSCFDRLVSMTSDVSARRVCTVGRKDDARGVTAPLLSRRDGIYQMPRRTVARELISTASRETGELCGREAKPLGHSIEGYVIRTACIV